MQASSADDLLKARLQIAPCNIVSLLLLGCIRRSRVKLYFTTFAAWWERLSAHPGVVADALLEGEVLEVELLVDIFD